MGEEGKKEAEKGGGPSHRRAEEGARGHGINAQKGQEEVNWTWKRKPLQGFSHSISLSYRKKVFDDIRSVLTCVGGEKLLQRFSDGCFGHLMRFVGGVSCSKALHEMISREITFPKAKGDELWFHVGETNIRFAIAEYALVTGLHFGSSTFDPLGSHEIPPEGLFMRLWKGRPITANHLWGLFNLQHLSMSPEDYLKVAHVLAMHLMALGYDQSKRIEPWVWVLVEDLDQWNSFPWGAYTYQALVHFVSILPTKRGNIKHRLRYFVSGPVWALQVYNPCVYCLFNFIDSFLLELARLILQIWAYEAIPCLPNLCASFTREVRVPRCLKWSFLIRGKRLHKHILDSKLVCHVTLEPTADERLQPYWLSLQTQQPLGVRYPSPRTRQRQVVAPPPRVVGAVKRARVPVLYNYLTSTDDASASSSLPEPRHAAPLEPVEVPDTDGSVHSTPQPSERPSRRLNRTPRRPQRCPQALDEARFVDQVSGKVVDHLVQLLVPQMKQWINDRFDQMEKPQGCNAKSAKADAEIAVKNKKKKKSFGGGSSSMLDTGVAGDGISSSNQEDSVMPSERSREKRDVPIRPHSYANKPVKSEMKQNPANPYSSKTMTTKRLKTKKCPTSNEETSDGDVNEGSKSPSGDERRRKKKKRSKKRKQKYWQSSSAESSSSDGDRRRRNRRKCRRESSSESSDFGRRSSRRHHRSRQSHHRHDRHHAD
ncbi:uncharacterized protein LOC121770986 isoform X2 [Salvia splendens]|uniref:uncharacterized protein LOC121770986 isoform X2 n=1 Tax=Salvia splendens TaxID=180675 RepID=UPI001C25B5F8|nr:uncharacterized protein LOC121770986 isoform X2 [Salvia splendens]